MTKQYKEIDTDVCAMLAEHLSRRPLASFIGKQIEAVYGEAAALELLRLNDILMEHDAQIERLKGLLARAADALIPLSHPVKCGCNVCRLLDELRKAAQ